MLLINWINLDVYSFSLRCYIISYFWKLNKYSFGDISSRIVELQTNNQLGQDRNIILGTKSSDGVLMESSLAKELEAMDEKTQTLRQEKADDLLR